VKFPMFGRKALVVGAAAAALLGGSAAPALAAPDLNQWNAVWDKIGGWHFDPNISMKLGNYDTPPYTPEFAKIAKGVEDSEMAGKPMNDPGTRCLSRGGVQMMMNVYPLEFIATPKQITIIHEYLKQTTRVYMDGRPLPEDPEPTFDGTGVGHWEGDTLVMDITGFRDDLTLTGGLPLGPGLHMHERLHLENNGQRLVNEITLTGKAFTKPYSITRVYNRSKFEMMEYICENNRNPVNADGITGVTLQTNGKEHDDYVK
jgi:hypothetical protein